MANILVVDDYQPSRTALAAVLTPALHRVVEARDGIEALAEIRAQHFDLVLCDLRMPRMDGYEFVRQLRTDPALPATRVICGTAT